ncbi:MAG TPA: sugar phosphate isomerase/epimerase, partial [Ktedonobacterales bacterium]
MRFSFSTGTLYPWPLEWSLRLARDLGYDGVELVMGPEALYLGDSPLLRAIERVGLPVLSVHPPFSSLPGWPRWPARRLPRVVKLARTLGAEVAITHTLNFYEPDSPRSAHFSEALRQGNAAGEGQVALTIENNQYYHHLLRGRLAYLDHTQRLVNYARTRGCGLTYDTCHTGASHEDVLLAGEQMRPLLRNVHLNDMAWRGGRPRTHTLPGEGDLPLGELLQRLAASGYDGLVTVELHPREIGWWGVGSRRR